MGSEGEVLIDADNEHSVERFLRLQCLIVSQASIEKNTSME